MVFRFGDVRGGFGYAGTISMNDMRNRKSYNEFGTTAVISGGNPISLSFAPTGTWYADNRNQGIADLYADNTTYGPSSGYNYGSIEYYVYFRCVSNGTGWRNACQIKINGVVNRTITEYIDKDYFTDFYYGPFYANLNYGNSLQILRTDTAFDQMRMYGITYRPGVTV